MQNRKFVLEGVVDFFFIFCRYFGKVPLMISYICGKIPYIVLLNYEMIINYEMTTVMATHFEKITHFEHFGGDQINAL